MKTTVVKSTYNLNSVETYEGETIETKVARIVQEKAPITDGAPIIYTDNRYRGRCIAFAWFRANRPY